jgi:hypothetical protein
VSLRQDTGWITAYPKVVWGYAGREIERSSEAPLTELGSQASASENYLLIDIIVSNQRQELRKVPAGHHLFVHPRSPRERLAADGAA